MHPKMKMRCVGHRQKLYLNKVIVNIRSIQYRVVLICVCINVIPALANVSSDGFACWNIFARAYSCSNISCDALHCIERLARIHRHAYARHSARVDRRRLRYRNLPSHALLELYCGPNTSRMFLSTSKHTTLTSSQVG